MADLLGCAPSTLRHWQHLLAETTAPLTLLGRPHARAEAPDVERVLAFLDGHGPCLGLPALRAEFPAVPRAALQDLLACYRHLWAANHPREVLELHWQAPGLVWAVDFTELS
jgi:hypothetical protein